jgi:hypothetical protein
MDLSKLSCWERALLSLPPRSPKPSEAFEPRHHFRYELLDLYAGPDTRQSLGNTQDIRLFALSPSDSFDHEIEGGLFHVSLEDHPVYETVSYVVSTAGIIFFFQARFMGLFLIWTLCREHCVVSHLKFAERLQALRRRRCFSFADHLTVG